MRKQGELSLKRFASLRNKILFNHKLGGLGDVFMQRMLFREVKNILPDAEIHFACLPAYIPAIADHPFIDQCLSVHEVNEGDYLAVYDTSVALANQYENRYTLQCKYNRADIWSKYCGFDLPSHDMDFALDAAKVEACRQQLVAKCNKNGPVVLFCPVSKMRTKSLMPHQIAWVIKACQEFNLIGINDKPVPELDKAGIPGVYGQSIPDWMHFVAAGDYMISVDSAAFHLAGGLRKPLLGVFTFANGKTYGMHYDFILVQNHFEDGIWDCGPCYNFKACPKTKGEIKPCLSELTKEQFDAGLKALFNRWKPANPLPASKISFGKI